MTTPPRRANSSRSLDDTPVRVVSARADALDPADEPLVAPRAAAGAHLLGHPHQVQELDPRSAVVDDCAGLHAGRLLPRLLRLPAQRYPQLRDLPLLGPRRVEHVPELDQHRDRRHRGSRGAGEEGVLPPRDSGPVERRRGRRLLRDPARRARDLRRRRGSRAGLAVPVDPADLVLSPSTSSPRR